MRHYKVFVQGLCVIGMVGLLSCSGSKPTGDTSQTQVTQDKDQKKGIEVKKEGFLGATWVSIQPGKTVGSVTFPETFLMGSPAGESESDADEVQHEVKLTKPFEIMTTEVTQEQWFKVMGHNPSHFKCDDQGKVDKDGKGTQLCPNHPVENVSWNDIAGKDGFIETLNEQEKETVYTYRLPTEAEWEYAARAGTTMPYGFQKEDKEAKLDDYAWYDSNSVEQTHPVGQKKPNDWGLYDMHGNVWEWVSDGYGDYPKESVTDPEGPKEGKFRVLRGGGWDVNAEFCRSANRNDFRPDRRGDVIGFRLVKTKK